MMKQKVMGMAVCAGVMAAAGVANADTYGNTTPFEVQGNHSANIVLGVQVSIPVDDFQITSFGMMYGHEDSGGVRAANALFALYSSGSDGLPENLVASTNGINLNTVQTYDNIAFTSTPTIGSGTYWMMAMYETDSDPRMSVLDGGSLVAYWSWNYGDGMPASSPGNTTYEGQNLNYWVNGNVPSPSALAALGVAGLFGVRRRRSA